ncbi:MAG: transporter substrate-binding domain-containing protein [Erysipelotrichales bacterium]|nr:transporter substrate-binding domain-containing protein [Erysipelotrichales bacterium]
MKKLLGVCIIALFAFTLTACGGIQKFRTPGYLTVGISPDYPPYQFFYADGTTIVGSDVDFANYLADKLGVELRLVPMEFGAILTQLQLGRIDIGISAFTYESERAVNFHLTNSYFNDGEGSQGILVHRSNLETHGTFELLNNSNVTVAAQHGSVQHALVSEHLPQARLQTISAVDLAVPLLINGNVQAIAVAEVVARQIMNAHEDLIFIEDTFYSPYSGLLAVINRNNQELFDAVQAIIADFDQDLYAKWLEAAQELHDSLGLN